MPAKDQAEEPPTECIIELGWDKEFAFAGLSALAAAAPKRERADIAVASGDPARFAQMAYCRNVARYLGTGPIGDLPFPSDLIQSPYAVRVHDEHALSRGGRRTMLGAVWASVHQPSVDLARPRTELHAYVTPDGIAWGLSEGLRKFEPREHELRPFSRAYAVPSRRARWLNDLAGVVRGARVLDPFCGTASVAIEAARLGAVTDASDIDRATVEGARANAEHERVSCFFKAGDALDPGLWSRAFDAVVTDLPYGRSASLRGRKLDQLAAGWLESVRGQLAANARVVVMSPQGAIPPDLDGLDVDTRMLERVHRHLTREIVVLTPR